MLVKPAHILFQEVLQRLSGIPEPEAQDITKRLLEHHTTYTPVKYVLQEPLELSEENLEAIFDACHRINRHEPLQYILGYADFYGCQFEVNPHVLIPRSTTEEMVDYLIRHVNTSYLRVLDLCTGSGCIAISLAKSRKNLHVDALDISQEAIAIAQKNARRLGVSIHFHTQDLLRENLPNTTWDLMVSNPPYIPQGDKDTIAERVLNHEPHQALFVPDHRPLLFYERIIFLALKHLSSPGLLCLEAHENFATHIGTLCQKSGFKQVAIHHDLQAKPRWITAQKAL